MVIKATSGPRSRGFFRVKHMQPGKVTGWTSQSDGHDALKRQVAESRTESPYQGETSFLYFLEIKDLVHLGQQTLVQKLAQKRCTVRFVETVATDRQREGGNPQQSRIPQPGGDQLRRAPGKEESWTPLRGAPRDRLPGSRAPRESVSHLPQDTVALA